MKNNNLALPDIEKVCEKQHESWVASKKAAGITSKANANGEEMMLPYDQLSEDGKNVVRNVVNTVYKAIEEAAEETPATQQPAAATL